MTQLPLQLNQFLVCFYEVNICNYFWSILHKRKNENNNTFQGVHNLQPMDKNASFDDRYTPTISFHHKFIRFTVYYCINYVTFSNQLPLITNVPNRITVNKLIWIILVEFYFSMRENLKFCELKIDLFCSFLMYIIELRTDKSIFFIKVEEN